MHDDGAHEARHLMPEIGRLHLRLLQHAYEVDQRHCVLQEEHDDALVEELFEVARDKLVGLQVHHKRRTVDVLFELKVRDEIAPLLQSVLLQRLR